MMDKKLFAIIVAGGSGLRMAEAMPKQFIKLQGKPILMHTLNVFNKIEGLEIILVLPEDHIQTWRRLCSELDFLVSHKIVEGGKTRGESVVNGLNVLPENGLVAIHDGVRPFISESVIRNSFETALAKGSAVAAVDLKDSIREVTVSGSKAVDRANYKIVQTPQTFSLWLIKEAYKNPGSMTRSDDASVAESAGFEIELIAGSYENIKITTPEDLIVAQEILKKL